MSENNESGSESEYEEEEEAVVLVELKGVIDSDLLNQASFDRFKIIGIETDNPILQLNNYYFSGEYCDTIGTAILLEEDSKKYKQSDPIFCNAPTTRLNYVCTTAKSLNMKRVFINSNQTNDQEKNPDSDLEENVNVENTSEKAVET